MAKDFSSWFTTLKRQTGNQQGEDSGLSLPSGGAVSLGVHQTCPREAPLGSPGPCAPIVPLSGSHSVIIATNSIISIPWELARNADSQAAPQMKKQMPSVL